MSGMIVERRDQVLMTDLVPLSFWASTFLSRWSSTNGPFLRLRGMVVLLPYRRDPRVRRRRTMSFWDGLVLSRVRPSGLAHRDTRGRPPEGLPSPPPWGGATGVV